MIAFSDEPRFLLPGAYVNAYGEKRLKTNTFQPCIAEYMLAKAALWSRAGVIKPGHMAPLGATGLF